MLNDPAAEALGGIENYWDRENTLPGVVSLALPHTSNCTGTLINSRTILTAAHCLVGKGNVINQFVRDGQYTIRFAPDIAEHTAHDRPLSGARVHPGYLDLEFGHHDIALLSLDAPVTGVAPVRLYRPGGPQPELGSLVTIAGYGLAGTASDPRAVDDSRRRIAQTLLVDEVPLANPTDIVYVAQFRDPLSPDDPDDAGLDALGFPVPFLQGDTAPGDSGGPVFLVTEQGLIQIGTLIGGGPEGYGSDVFWTAVPYYLDWLARENPLRDSVSREGRFDWSDARAWSEGPPDNVDGHFDGFGALGRYYNVAIGDRSRITLDRDPVIDSLAIAGRGARLDLSAGRVLESILGVTVSDGTLVVDGDLRTLAGVHLTGGELHGSGNILALEGVVNTGGIVAPGGRDALGTLTIDGSYRQGEAGGLAIDIVDREVDLLAVSGRAGLAGDLTLHAAIDRFDPEYHYTIVSADGGVSATFSTVTDARRHAFIAPSVAYGAHAVNVRFERNDTPFASIAPTRNTQSAARALEGLDGSNPLYQSVVLTRSENVGALGNTLDLLTGEAHASAVSIGYGQAQALHGLLLGRLRNTKTAATPTPDGGKSSPLAYASAMAGAAGPVDPITAALAPHAPAPAFSLWGSGIGAWGKVRSNGNTATLDTATGGFVIGGEAALGDGYRLGVAGGYERTSFDVDGRLSSGVGESVFGALYGSARWGVVSLRAGAAYSFNDTRVRRGILLPTYRDATAASYDGNTLSAFGEIGYRIAFGRGEIEPFAGASFIRLHTDGFHERGGAAALWSPDRTHDLGTTTLGLRAATTVGDTAPLSVRGLLGWRHAFGDVKPEALLSLGGAANAFRVEGAPVDRNAMVAEAGIDWRPVEALTVGITVGAQIGPKAQTHTVKGNLVWRF